MYTASSSCCIDPDLRLQPEEKNDCPASVVSVALGDSGFKHSEIIVRSCSEVHEPLTKLKAPHAAHI